MQLLPDVRPEFLELVRDAVPHRLRTPACERIRHGVLSLGIVEVAGARDDECAGDFGDVELRVSMAGTRLGTADTMI